MTLDLPNNNNFERWVIVGLVIAFIVVLMASCSCEYHLDRVKSKCGITALNDTTVIYDTVIVIGVRKDTVFHYLQKDTVIVEKGRLTMKYFYNTKDSTVYLKGDCKTDTIIKTIKVKTTSYEVVYNIWNTYKWWILGIVILLLILFIIKTK
ncbi:MAG: hypothetical protein ACP5N7_01350 [Candidatus Pacearchaeota archaeon]